MDNQDRKLGLRAICRHFGDCGGDRERWDARRLAIMLFLNRERERQGLEPLSTGHCIGQGVDPALIERMAMEAVEMAFSAIYETFFPDPIGPPLRDPQTEDMRTWVYFIQGADGGPIKIGISRDMEVRLVVLQSCSPVRLKFIGRCLGGQPLERKLHRHFRGQRLHGEWFEATPELLETIHRLMWGQEKKRQ